MRPRSIAVVGASERASRGTLVVRNLLNTEFAGQVFAINPRYTEILGFPCYPRVSEVPAHVDCVVVAVPAAAVPGVLEDAFAAGTRGAVVLSSGFGEGGHDDSERVRRIRDLAEQGMSICGPNCYGVLNVYSGAAAFSGPTAALTAGPVAVVSQSGGFSTVIGAPLMEDHGIGCSFIVSCGNQIGVPVESYLRYVVEDPQTRVVAAFIEGFSRPDLLPEVARRARELGKPVVVLKSGRSERGSRAVLSHTGSLAGRPEILSALLDRYGFVQVETIDQLVETTALFATADMSRRAGNEIVVITGSGGESSHMADAADAVGLPLATLSDVTTEQLSALLPEFGVAGNPVDGTGAMFENPELFPQLLQTAIDDPQDAIVALNLGSRPPRSETAPAPMRRFAAAAAEVAGRTDKLIIAYGTSALGAPDTEMIGTLQKAGIPYLVSTETAVRAISSLQRYRRFAERGPVRDAVQEMQPSGARGVLPFLQARELLDSYGIPVVQTSLVTDAEQAVAAAEGFGYPVVLKAEAAGLVHKTEAGGVIVGCADAAAVAAGYAAVTENVRRAGYTDIAGVLVQPMSAKAVEVVAGVNVDPDLGPAVLFGLGGIFVEVIKDTITIIPPFDLEQAKDHILSIKANAILRGARGTEPVNLDALANLLVALGDFAVINRDRLVTVDLNPILASPTTATAVDAIVEFQS